ncbi:transporter substrate-binding domain-containing protein [Loigolactobacillus jiayinensis]|uniref:Transporter substrate-binding domain-containing protein n=1 Tax=Loigolactobacillus jiayinensis TaxID=2486016 RepID=A0ABW1RFH7_9LACO
MKRKLGRLLMLLLVIMTVILPLASVTNTANAATTQKTTLTDKHLSSIKKKGYITVGLSADYPPYEFHQTIKGQDKIVGFDISIAEKIAKDLGVKLKVNEMGFDALLGALKTGKIDMIISGMSKTPEREKEVTFSKSYLNVKQVVMAKKEDAGKLRSSSDYEGVKVGVQKQSFQEELAQKELFGAKITSLQKMTDLVLNLQNNKIAEFTIEVQHPMN